MLILNKQNLQLIALSFTSVFLYCTIIKYFNPHEYMQLLLLCCYLATIGVGVFVGRYFNCYSFIRASYHYILPVMVPLTMGFETGALSHCLYFIVFLLHNTLCTGVLYKQVVKFKPLPASFIYILVGIFVAITLSSQIPHHAFSFALALVAIYLAIPFQDLSTKHIAKHGISVLRLILLIAGLSLIRYMFTYFPLSQISYLMYICCYPIVAVWACNYFRHNNFNFSLALLSLVLVGLIPVHIPNLSFMVLDHLDITVIAALTLFFVTRTDVIYRTTSKYGNLRVLLTKDQHLCLYHNDTLHGIEHKNEQGKLELCSYYAKTGPLGQVFAAYPDLQDVAIIGLGIGNIALYGKKEQNFDYYEIDPEIEKIAKKYFHCLKRSKANLKVIIGDARETLNQAKDHHYDLIISDAYSGNDIPKQLLTFEAINMFVSKLKPTGILCMHITNRDSDLPEVLAKICDRSSLIALCQYQDLESIFADEKYIGLIPARHKEEKRGIPEICNDYLHYFLNLGHPCSDINYSSKWVVITRDIQNLSQIKNINKWHKIEFTNQTPLWQDNMFNFNPFSK